MPTPTLRALTTYEVQALARLPTQFRGKPRLEAMLLALAGQHQDAEVGLYTLWAQRLLATATGAALTQLGAVVGQERGGLADESFRLRIYARLLINRSSGTIPELLAIFALISPLLATLTEYPPAAFELTLSGGEASLPEDFAAILQAARAAGVGAGLLFQTEADADTFTFLTEDAAGEGFPITSYDSSVGAPVEVVNPGGATAPVLALASPPELAQSYFVTIVITFVDVPGDEVFFDYTLFEGDTVRSGSVSWIAPNTALLAISESPFVPSGLEISFTEDEPYAAGDTWTWEVQGPAPGGSLSGVLSA